MAKDVEKYLVDGVDLEELRNRNEARVAECMREELDKMIDNAFSEKDLQDVYAYALNQLPARYTQKGTIVLRDPVHKNDVRATVREAFEHILNNPKE